MPQSKHEIVGSGWGSYWLWYSSIHVTRMGILAGSGDTGKAFAHQIVLEGLQTSESLETNPREGLLDITWQFFHIFPRSQQWLCDPILQACYIRIQRVSCLFLAWKIWKNGPRYRRYHEHDAVNELTRLFAGAKVKDSCTRCSNLTGSLYVLQYMIKMFAKSTLNIWWYLRSIYVNLIGNTCLGVLTLVPSWRSGGPASFYLHANDAQLKASPNTLSLNMADG